MAEGKPEVPIQKTPEQIQNQVKWAQAVGHKDCKPFSVENFAKADHQTIKKAIELDQKALDEMPEHKRRISYSPVIVNYGNYLANLRTLRRLQKEQIGQAMKDVPSDITPKEHYLQSITYPQEFTRQFVEGLQSGSSKRFFTDEQVNEATKTEEGFKTLVKEIIVKNPSSYSWYSEEIDAFFAPEERKELMLTIAKVDPASFLEVIGKQSELFTDPELKTLISQAVAANTYGIPAYNRLADPEISKLFTKKELRSMVLGVLGKVTASSLGDSATKVYVLEGILTKADVANQIMTHLRSDSSYSRSSVISTIKSLSEYLDENQLEEARQNTFEFFINTTGLYVLYIARDLEGILTKEQLKEITQVRLAKCPGEFSANYEIVKEHLSVEERKKFIEEATSNKVDAVFNNVGLQLELLNDEDLPEHTKRIFFEKLFRDYPQTVSLHHFQDMLKIFSPEDTEKTVKKIVEAQPFYAFDSIQYWIKFISDDLTIQKQYLSSLISQTSGFSFAVGYAGNRQFQKLFTQEEMKSFIYQQLGLGAEGAFINLSSIRKVLGSDKEFRHFIDQAIIQDPYGILGRFDRLAYLYKPNEVIEIVGKARMDIKGIAACLDNLSYWGPSVPKDYVRNFLLTYAPIYSETIWGRLETCLEYIEEAEQYSFIQNLININPANGIRVISIINKLFPDITEAQILQIGQVNTEVLRFAPLNLGEFYKDYPRLTDERAKRALLKDVADIYNYISYIQYFGLTDSLLNAQRVERKPGQLVPLPKARELELLSVFQSFALLKSRNPDLLKDENLGNSVDEAGMILLGKLSEHIGIGKQITQEDTRRFFAVMQTPAPFTIYYLEHEVSPEHKKILGEMFNAILEGNFHIWKFAAESEEHFNIIKAQKLIPEKLSYEQYQIWAKDAETTLFDSLSASAESVIDSIRDLITNNDEHLGFSRTDLSGCPLDQIASGVQVSLAKSGQALAQINRQLLDLRKGGKSDSDEFNSVLLRRGEIEQERNAKLKLRNILKIILLRPEELVSGYFRDKSDLTKKVGLIADTLEQLKDQSPPEAAFVFETINQLVDNFYAVTQEKQNLTTIDSSNPKVMMEIGENPVSSCQHYAHGSHNDCLIGYSDPNTKILIIRNDKGSVIARSIFRLLTDSEGNPSLHLERIYTAVSSPAIPRSLYTHAYKKAAEMGVRLYVTMSEQSEDQGKTRTYLPEGFNLDKSGLELNSFASRTPKVYVDSAQGIRSFGQYTIKNLAEVRAD
ncbi:hypothetical protein C4577_01680 [Candidatus Parcubacteria bacterium]|nr:MAG: hypothetical protein C4577_01680 [Candidatus Parcubacteria bacterium]